MGALAAAVPLAALTLREAAFGGLALFAIVTALLVVVHRTPVMQGLFLVLHLLSIAGLFAALDARFLAVLQVLIYAGAVVVLIVFVIMLLNLRPEARGGPGYLMLLVSLLLGAALIALLAQAGGGFVADPSDTLTEGYGTPEQLAGALFETYFYAFEVVSLALVAAMIGAVLMAKRYLEG